jgi:hypothetical protein
MFGCANGNGHGDGHGGYLDGKTGVVRRRERERER